MRVFTGLIEEMGTIAEVSRPGAGLSVTVRAGIVPAGLAPGDSVAVSGVCLTAVRAFPSFFTADVAPETEARSTLCRARAGDRVNLERALRADARLGGHIVAGHADGAGRVTAVRTAGNARILTVAPPAELLRYIVGKGSIAVDGVSLTVMDVDEAAFRVSVIPHTAAATTLQFARPGTAVNLEVDIIGKYVEKLLAGYRPGASGGGLAPERLRALGY